MPPPARSSGVTTRLIAALIAVAVVLALAVLVRTARREPASDGAGLPAAAPTGKQVVLATRVPALGHITPRPPAAPAAEAMPADTSEQASVRRAIDQALAAQAGAPSLGEAERDRLAAAILQLRAARHGEGDAASAAAALAEIEVITGTNLADLGDLLAQPDPAP